jgi:hypothetical protein
MKREFSYLEKDGQYFPVIDVKLGSRKNKLTVKALIDSGASFSVFRPEIAQELGIELERGKKIYLTGVGGRILGYLHKVPISVGNKNFLCKIVFSSEFNVSFSLLGRDNFFIPFIISFLEKNKKIILKWTNSRLSK